MSIARTLSHHVRNAEPFASTFLREKEIAEGLEAQNYTPSAHHQLRRSNPEETQDIMDEGSQWKLHP